MRNFLFVASLISVAAMAETVTGIVSDEKCGAKHMAATAADKSCVETCTKGGAAPVIVSEGKVYKIAEASRDKVKSRLGEKVIVNGKVEDDTITIDTVQTPAS